MPQITLIFADGDSATVEARAEETVMAAARRQGIQLSSDCEVGDCQTCRSKILSGEVEYDEYASISLTPDEVEAGEVLTCVGTPTTDVTIRLPYERGRLLPAKPFPFRVEAINRLGASVAQLRGRTTGLSPLTFLPGQYVNLKAPGADQWRSYSMANAPGADKSIELLVRLLDEGVMSRYLAERAAPGDLIDCRGPLGAFYLRGGGKPLLMVAGGTGIAPMASMLRQMIGRRDDRPVALCFGVNRDADLFYLDELAELGRGFSSFDLRLAVIDGGKRPGVQVGYVTDLIRSGDGAGRDVYLCGPPAMTDAARARLVADGTEEASIFVERFVPVGETLASAAA